MLLLPGLCCLIGSTAADKHVKKVQILQNHVERVTLRCKAQDKHVSEIYDELKSRGVLSGKVGTGMCGPDSTQLKVEYPPGTEMDDCILKYTKPL